VQETHDLILRIYDTALDPRTWPRVLAEVAAHCGATGAFVFEMRREAEARTIEAVHYSHGQDASMLDAYLAQFAEQELIDQDYFAEMSKKGERIRLIPDDGLAGHYDPLGGLEAQPHIQLQRQFGFNARAGALLNKDDYYRDRFALVYKAPETLTEPELKSRTELLLPHIAKALDVTRPTARLQDRYAGIVGAIDHLNLGVCVISNDRSIVFQNDEFKRQLEAYHVMSRGPDGRLNFNQNNFGADLAALLSDVGAHGHHGARPRREAVVTSVTLDHHTLCIELLPLQHAEAYGEMRLNGHIIYSLDTSRMHRIRTKLIQQLFGLTKSEAEVLELMAEGLTNREISERRGKSTDTINTQVKALYPKMQVENRTQAVRLATNLSSSLRQSAADDDESD